MADKQVLLTYSVLDGAYANGLVRFAGGLRDAAAGTPSAGTVDNPSDTGVPLASTDPDPKLFSFAYKGGAWMLLAKVVTPVSGAAAYTTWTLIDVPTTSAGTWTVLAEDIILQYPAKNPATVATNPYGVAQAGDWLYIVDYDSQKIYTLGVTELAGLPKGSTHVLNKAPLDLGPYGVNQLPVNAKGQGIIALANGGETYLFALYIDLNSTTYVHSAGRLVRLKVDAASGAPAYDTQTEVGLNPQEIVPVFPANGDPTLLIPAIGGEQQAGTTNGTDSVISNVPAFGTWPATADVHVTGNARPIANAYDFHAIAAPDRQGDSTIYILTIDYVADYAGSTWALYSTTVSNLLSLPLNTPIANAGFTLVDSGTAPSGYFWAIFYENGDSADNDRLWFFQGSPILINPALAYTPLPQTSPENIYFAAGTGAGTIGGQNVDWADLTSETLRQAAAGISLKRSIRSVLKAPPAVEEEEEK